MKQLVRGFLVVVVLISLAYAGSAGEANFDTGRIEDLILVKVNSERARSGLDPLVKMEKLQIMSRTHSRNMVLYGFFSHIDHEKRDPSLRKQKFFPELCGGVGENIAYNYGDSEEDVAERLVRQWMNSPGHRENILRKSYIQTGIGVVKKENRYYATQVFGEIIAEMVNPAPRDVKYGATVTLRFRYLGNFHKNEVRIMVQFPDRQVKFRMPAGHISTGMGLYEPVWDGDIFSAAIECKYGTGEYAVTLGRGNSFYPEGIVFTVNR